MKKTTLFLGTLMMSFSLSLCAFGQLKPEKGPWRKVNESEIPANGTRMIFATKFTTFKLDVVKIEQQLAQVKRITDPNYIPVFLELPLADGSFHRYQIHENTTMAEGLAANFPTIRSFNGVPMSQTGELVKLDLTPQGFHAVVLFPDKPTSYIDPYTFGGSDIEHYMVYSKADFTSTKIRECGVDAVASELKKKTDASTKSFGDCQFRTYRLALSASAEYTNFHGGTVANALAAQVTTMNRVNGVYERDMAITMNIIANNNLIIYTNAGSDPFTNGNPGAMIAQNQTNTNSVIGSANYDIGHVFGTNSGGLAGLGVVCSSSKARGVTGSGAPIGDPFDIDYVAHEMGHQFDCNHTFNGTGGACAGNGNPSTAMEPGSGSTIMAYAGICSPQDVQPNSDDHFHGISLEEMGNFVTSPGHTCPVESSTSNTPPMVSGTTGSGVTIPANTPFALTATATDPNGDILTYCWEQMDNQSSTQPPVGTATVGPNFRSFSPTTNPTRYFPSIASQLAGGPYTWERLPTVSRTMNFRVSVRDNNPNGGCNDEQDITFSTTSTAGPFVVNYPTATGITWIGNSNQTVTWSVANTTASPVSCANVDILISLDGGVTFSNIANNVPNDGSQTVIVPNTSSTTAIIMVICENGAFFDISNNVFTITAATEDYTVTLSPTTISVCQGTDAVYTVTVGQIGSYSDPVTLTVSGLPGGVTSNFSMNPVIPGNTTTLTLSNTISATPGSYSISVDGTSTSGAHSGIADLLISGSSVVASTLTSPVDTEPSAPVTPTLIWTNPDAGVSYDIEIATDAAFTSIVESATGLSTNSYSATLLVASTTYFWRVNSYTSCSAAQLSATFSFTTSSCGNFASTNVPVTISASGTPTVTSTLFIPTGGIINDLQIVDFSGTHTWINDLEATLTSPSGTVVPFYGQICDNENDFDVNFDDEAAPGALPCPPVGGGTYQPASVLSAFDGENMSGTWTLTVQDNVNEDGGALASWGLNICFTPAAACINPTVPTVSGIASFCTGNSTTLSIGTGALNDATNWQWYSGSCGGTSVGSGTSISVNTAGTYFVRGEGGCVTPGACQSVTVTQNTVNLGTTITSGIIYSNQTAGTYQWIDCGNGNMPVSGATTRDFTPTVNGSYAVQVTAPNGCSGTSACVNYNQVGIEEFDFSSVSLFPNPTTGFITIQFNQLTEVTSMNLTDVTGRLVRVQDRTITDAIELDLTQESKGVYFLNLQVGSQTQTLKITRN